MQSAENPVSIMFFRIIFLILTLGSSIHALKILVLFTTPSVSNQRPIMALTERLVQRGHEVFAVSPNEVPGLKSSNYTYVNLSSSYKSMSDRQTDGTLNFQRRISKWDTFSLMAGMNMLVQSQFLSEPFLDFQRRVREEKLKFDVTIVQGYLIPYLCPISRHLTGNTPIISLSTANIDYFAEVSLGSLPHLSYVPSLLDSYTNKMSLWQKIENWYSDIYILSKARNLLEEGARNFFRETYGAEDLLDGCWNNVSLSMIASNSLYYYPRLLGPNVIELGPMHLNKQPEKLPKNLQDWLDGAEKGVIYFSLGSNMKSKSLPEDVRSNFLKFFRELPSGYRVLWKWELEGKIPGQSDNILAQTWLPQHSILAHSKVKVFITQGGLQSFHEAVHYGVPTVVIPWFGDQESNAAKMEDAEIGVRLRPQELDSYEKIKTALEAVLYDDRYSRNMKRLSAISRDFTSTSVDKGVFWVEHVARHGGASHLRPSTAETTYFQFFCLDIISVILVLSFIILYIIYSACKFLIFKASNNFSPKIKRS